MFTMNPSLDSNLKGRLSRSLALTVCAALVGLAQQGFAQQPGQRTFASAAEACQALFQAVQKEDEQALEAVIGKEVLSPNKEEARLDRHHFTDKYQQMHRLVQEPEGTTVLYVGAENWPFPVPLVSKNGKWYFDSALGKQEIVFRRVGENEISALEVCDQFLAARKQTQKAAAASDPMSQYAANLARGNSGAAQKPFHGYYFQTVSGSGNGKNALALVAYPAEYRSSGVTTFIVSGDGAVFEKDLGTNTAQAAKQLNQRPASGWDPVQ
jgi:type IV secretory pathway VirJ component